MPAVRLGLVGSRSRIIDGPHKVLLYQSTGYSLDQDSLKETIVETGQDMDNKDIDKAFQECQGAPGATRTATGTALGNVPGASCGSCNNRSSVLWFLQQEEQRL